MLTQGPETNLYGIGKGAAQVAEIDVSDQLNQRAAAKKAQEDGAGNKRIEGLEKEASTLGSASIHPRDRQHFADLQGQLMDFTTKNVSALRKGNPATTMEWQNQYSKLKTEAELSKNLREQMEQLQKQKDFNIEELRPESQQYVHRLQFGEGKEGKVDYSDWNKAYNVDFGKIKKNVDYHEHYAKDLLAERDKRASETGGYYVDKEGRRITTDKEEFTADQGKELIAEDLKNPHYFEQAQYELSKEPQSVQQKFNGNPVAYYQDKWAPQLAKKKVKTGASAKESGYGYGDEDVQISTEDKPLELKANDQTVMNTSPLGTVTGPLEAVFPISASVTHKKPIFSLSEVTPQMRDMNTNEPIKETGEHQVDYGKTTVMPIDKKTGALISKGKLAKALNDGTVKYETMVLGKIRDKDGNEGTSFYRPASEIKSTLVENKVPLEKLEEIAKQKNEQLGVKPKPKKSVSVSKSNAEVKGKTISVSKLNEVKKSKYTVDQIKKMFPDANVVE